MVKRIKKAIENDIRRGGKVFGLIYSSVVISMLALTAFLVPFYLLDKSKESEEDQVEVSAEELVDEESLVSFGDMTGQPELEKKLSGFLEELVGEELVEGVKNTVTTVVDEDKVRDSFEELREMTRPGGSDY